MTGRSFADETYRYGFNGKENDADFGDKQLIQDYGFRLYNPSISKFLSVDPLASDYPSHSNYSYAINNPIRYMDILGLAPGDYYKEDGTWIGSDGKDDNKVYAVHNDNAPVVGEGMVPEGLTDYKKDAKGELKYKHRTSGITYEYDQMQDEILGGEEVEELNISHSDFTRKASTIYGESSATTGFKASPSDLKYEMYAIASVHERNNTAYGVTNDAAVAFRNKKARDRNGTKMQIANAALINSLTGGFDYSHGASGWDGMEQGQYPASNNNRSTGRYELHMNTMGWRIELGHWVKWKENIGRSFKAPIVKSATVGSNKGKIRYTSAAVYGRTIFWKID